MNDKNENKRFINEEEKQEGVYVEQSVPYQDIKEEEDDNDGHGGSHHEEGHSTYISASFHIINTIMGAGILSLPVVFRYLGVVLGTIFIAFIAYVTTFSVYLLLRCKDMTHKNGYAMFAKISYGAVGSLMVKVIIIINNFGMCCAYLRIFGETAHNLADVFFDSQSFWVTNWHNFFYVAVIFIVMFFLIFKKNMDSLKSASFLGVLGITIFFICLLIIFFYKLSQGRIDLYDSFILWPQGNALDIIGALPTVFLAFTFQFNLFPIYFTLNKRTKNEMMKASTLAIVFCFIIYVCTGFIGYYMYRLTLKDTILEALTLDIEQYKGNDNFLIVILIIINVAFLISSTMSLPLMFFSLKHNFINSIIFCKKKYGSIKNVENDSNSSNKLSNTNNDLLISNEQSKLKENTSNSSLISEKAKVFIIIILYFLIGVITILVPGLKVIFNVVGSTAANSISFILPSLLFLKLSSMGKVKVSRIFPTFLLVTGIIILIVCLVGEFLKIIIVKN